MFVQDAERREKKRPAEQHPMTTSSVWVLVVGAAAEKFDEALAKIQ